MGHYSVGILIYLCFICWTRIASITTTSNDAIVVLDGPSGNDDARNGYKGRYGSTPSRYQIVIPEKVTESGEFLTHTIPHHYKRSYYESEHQKQMGPDDMVHYILPIAGEKHHLQLVPNSNIASPGTVVEIHDSKGISKREIRKLNNVQCHYTGSIKDHKDSRAALSTCYGLSGYIRTKRGYYLIEPIAGYRTYSGSKHPHLLYQHESDPNTHQAACETSGDLAKILAKRTITEDDEETDEKAARKNISEYHIEAMVVVDKTMLKYHKEIDVENYVLTVFNMAYDLYHDASLETNINLAIVRLIRLEEEEHKLNLAINKDANKTLEFFRDWQNKMNPGDDTHPNHHDVAVLLTRVDICGNENNCGLLGISRMGGMCDPKNQAAVCEDSGLRLGFVIAHEIAHTLAIPHDTMKESGCNATLPDGLSTAMNPSVNIRTVEWSTCSPKFLRLFLNSGSGKCLYDPPTDHSFKMPDVLPGVMYGGDYQCRVLFGPNAALCDTGMECNNLVCYMEDKGCIETHMAVAPGTSCGEQKWCYRGKCIEIGERPGAVDGGWGPWSNWSDCSRSCGSGVANRIRHCNNPAPKRGGKYCVGEYKHHRICNTEPCDASQPSFRNTQCAEFNEWVYPEDHKMHRWKDYYMPDENPCILFCVNDQGEVASLRPRVIDGTKCKRGLRDICVDGICREIPCDLDLESNAVEDWCGICHGDGTACKLISGEQFVEQRPITSENENPKIKLLCLPKRTMNIKVEETEPSDAQIQVRSKDGKTVFIQGDVFGLYNITGTKAWLGNIRTKQEALNIPGPINDEISIWILARDNVTIKYSYGLKETTKRTPCFDWDYLDWTKCSAQCGPGTQAAVPRCIEKIAGLVDDAYCRSKTKPKEMIRPCEVAPCIPRWMIGEWQECSKCPRGTRTRIVKCVKPTGEGEGESVVISDSECAGPKPKHKESCTCSFKTGIKDTRSESDEQDSESKDLRRSLEELQRQPKSCDLSYTNFDLNTTTLPSVVIDKEDVDDVRLTVHTGDESCGNASSYTLEGLEAMKFLNKIQKDIANNKTRIRK